LAHASDFGSVALLEHRAKMADRLFALSDANLALAIAI
jgi:hypothetical protein